MKDFNQLPWHDAAINFIYINRKEPGEKDTITISISWPDDSHSFIEFYECFAFQANMNFGIVANESILTAECIYESDELIAIKKTWERGIDLSNLKCFKLITNSTNSKIEIYSLGYKLLNSKSFI